MFDASKVDGSPMTERERRAARALLAPGAALDHFLVPGAAREAKRMIEQASRAAQEQQETLRKIVAAPSTQALMLREQRKANDLLIATTSAVSQLAAAQATTDRRMLRLTVAILVLTGLGLVVGCLALAL